MPSAFIKTQSAELWRLVTGPTPLVLDPGPTPGTYQIREAEDATAQIVVEGEIDVVASGVLSGRTYTVTISDPIGQALLLFTISMTANGLPVTPTLISPGVWSYVTPDSTSDTEILWSIQDTDQAGSQVVPANLFAPTGTLTLSRTGRVVTFWIADAAGTGTLTRTVVSITDDGVNVAGSVTGAGTVASPWSYTATGSDEARIDIAVEMTNGITPRFQASDSIVVPGSFLPAPGLEGITLTDNGDSTGTLTVTFIEGTVPGTTFYLWLYLDADADPDPDATTVISGAGAVITGTATATVGQANVPVPLTGSANATLRPFVVVSLNPGGQNPSGVATDNPRPFNTTSGWVISGSSIISAPTVQAATVSGASITG